MMEFLFYYVASYIFKSIACEIGILTVSQDLTVFNIYSPERESRGTHRAYPL